MPAAACRHAATPSWSTPGASLVQPARRAAQASSAAVPLARTATIMIAVPAVHGQALDPRLADVEDLGGVAQHVHSLALARHAGQMLGEPAADRGLVRVL